MSPRNPPLDSYTPAALDAVTRALVTLVKSVGDLGPRLVVVGGMVPGLLVPHPTVGEPHVGTTDLDLALTFAVPAGDAPLYQSLHAALDESKFTAADRNDGIGLSTWQWVRTVDGLTVAVEFLAPADAVMAGGRPTVGRLAEGTPQGAGDVIGALRLPGAELPSMDYRTVPLTADALDKGGRTTVDVNIANLLPFVALKGLAVQGRNKDKDPHDVVWLLNAWGENGPSDAARDARASPVAGHPRTAQGLEVLRRTFATPADEGCARYARFALGADADDADLAPLARYAHGTLEQFFRAWDAGRDTTGS